MGDQGVQQMQQQQPIVVYPNSYTKQYPDPSSSGSRGSFTTVFIVVAVILVLSVVACLFGKLCNRERRFAKQKHHKHPIHEKGSVKKSREIRPVEREPMERGDMEFGFDMKQSKPIEKPSVRDHVDDIEFGFENNGEERHGGETPPPSSIKHGVRFKLPENEEQHAKDESPWFEFRPEH